MNQTPMMSQWQSCKEQAKRELDEKALLLFRLGDFYEAFYEDAQVLSEALSITLTKRQQIPMAGIPAVSLDAAIEELIQKGFKIAIAEQVEPASKENKTLLRREIVRRITPATHITTDGRHNLFFGTVIEGTKGQFGAAFLDLTTGEFITKELHSLDEATNTLAQLSPKELLLVHKSEIIPPLSCSVSERPLWFFDPELSRYALLKHFQVASLDGFGLKELDMATRAAGSLLRFIQEELHLPTGHLLTLTVASSKEHLLIDRISERNLELTESLFDKSSKGTLLQTIDKTETPMGFRLLRQWIRAPLFSKEQIESRQNAISELITGQLSEIKDALKEVRDLERLTAKVASDIASPKDLVALRESLKPLPHIKGLLSHKKASLLCRLADEIIPLGELKGLLERALAEEPPFRISDGGVIRDGYSEELDLLRALQKDSQSWMARYQSDLREKTAIKTLKVGYTKVSGFYIEVTRAKGEQVPPHFVRRQTLTSAERYITPELKEYEEKLVHAEEKILRLESQLFKELKTFILPHFKSLTQNGQAIARLDALQSLAASAIKYNWTKPLIEESDNIQIYEGRHPIIEMAGREPFVPNDTELTPPKKRLLLITGPNMAGKSTYIRQVALIVILAQMGSFVPAKAATIGLVDRLFTRIGAHDDLARGQSTFMVEMAETANILRNASDKSLVILDEIGRGTSTFDGISIARAVAEYLLLEPGRQAKTLFATHFSELSQLEESFEGAKNLTVAVHEEGHEITFLRKIIEGSSDKSYGVHVARLAGLPPKVLKRASELLRDFEKPSPKKKIKSASPKDPAAFQLTFI